MAIIRSKQCSQGWFCRYFIYLTDVSFKTHIPLHISLGLNLLYAALKLFYGANYPSVRFGTLAVYYSMLALMRFLLLHHVNRTGFGVDLVSELKRYRQCGVLLMLLNKLEKQVIQPVPPAL